MFDKKVKIQIKSIGGSVLFEYECVDNTIKKTVEKAISSSADLSYANLSSADLSYADLSSADLSYADLRYADLSSADLSSANLRYADLRYAKNWQDSWWVIQCKQNILFILSYLPKEVEGLKKSLEEGKVDGSQYEGECACLVGTLGNYDGGVDKVCSAIPFYTKGLENFGEQLFWQIKKGDTPKTNEFSKIAVELCDMAIKRQKVRKIKKIKNNNKEL